MWRLKIGNKLTGYTVQRDEKYPDVMWRIHAPDGQVSDMVNLTRAKDAAVAWARPKGLGGSEVANWDYRQTPSGARPAA